MTKVRTPPVLLAALVFAAGIAGGLRFGSGAGLPDGALVLLAVLLSVAVLLVVRRASDHELLCRARRATPLSLAAVACLGVLSGSAVRGRANRSCPADVLSGTTVVVAGTLDEPAVPRRGRARLEVRRAVLQVDGRACRLPAVTAYATMVDATVEAGTGVTVRGEWLRSRHRSGRWPAPADRLGYVSGRLTGVWSSSVPDGPLRRLRGAASRRLRERLPADVRPAATALILAERASVDPKTRRRFVEAGLAHLLAISGLHVGILAVGVVWLAGLAVPGTLAWPLGALTIAAYVASIGAPPSALRAALVFAGLAVARARGRPARILDIAAAAAIVALIRDPLVLVDPGFQMSFAGFGGVLLGAAVADRCLGVARGDREAEGRPRMLRPLLLGVAAGFGAFAATAPIAAAHFQRAAPVGVVSHLVGTPIVGLALAALAGAIVLPGLGGELSADAAATLLRILNRVAEGFAAIPLGHAEVSPPALATWLAVALGLWAALRCVGPGGRRSATIPMAAAGGTLLGGPAIAALAALAGGGHAMLCSLDVGQGDAAVLRTRGGRWMVFDAGPGAPASTAAHRVLLPRLRAGGAREIDMFVLSHPDLDHLGGAGPMFDRYRVRRVLDTGDPIPKPAYAHFLARVQEEGSDWLQGRAGDRFVIEDVALTVLGPLRAHASGGSGALGRDANETSLAFRVTVGGGFSYLNTGDATEREEKALLDAWPSDSIRADVMKVGHHGSRSSTHEAWLAAARPTVAVVSAGTSNAYGHPHTTVLKRLRAAGVPRVWRTDREGTLCVEIDGRGRWRLEGERGWRLPAAVLARDLTLKTGED